MTVRGDKTSNKMVWCFPWSDSIKKRACRYLLQRYLGQFLKEKLTLEQLSIDIYEGTGEIQDILLDVDALNELGAGNNLPVQFVDGYIRRVRFSVPWSALLTASSHVEISGLMLAVQATQMLDDAAMFDSMLDSMTTSTIDLAKECLQGQPGGGAGSAPASGVGETLEGIEALANAIDSVLLRIKVRFLDTVVRVEHVGARCSRGVGVQCSIRSMDYMDEAGRELTSPEAGGSGSPPALSGPTATAVKRLSLEGVTLHTLEFPAEHRAAPGGMAASFSDDKDDEAVPGSRCPSPSAGGGGPEPILLGSLSGRTELRCEVKVNDALPGPKLSLAVTAGAFSALLGPRQLHDLLQLLGGLVDPRTVDTSGGAARAAAASAGGGGGGGRRAEKPMTPSDYQVIEDQLLRRNLAARDLLTTQALRTQGWSASVLDDDDEEYVPLGRGDAGGALTSSVTSSAAASASGELLMDASLTSSATGSVFSDATSVTRSEMSYSRQQRSRRRRDRPRDEEPGVGEDALRLRVQLSTLSVLLLHDDLLAAAPDTGLCTAASGRQMQRLVESALCQLSSLSLSGAGGVTTVRAARPSLHRACPASHLSLVASPVQLECCERPAGGSSRSVFSLTLTAGTAELLECLLERRSTSAGAAGSPHADTPVYTELLTFNGGEPAAASSASSADPYAGAGGAAEAQAAATLTLKHSHHTTSRHSTVSVRLRLAACRSEVDISLTDRLSALLSPASAGASTAATSGMAGGAAAGSRGAATAPLSAEDDLTKQQCFAEAMNDAAGGGDTRMEIRVTAPVLDVRLRIPVPDLRPACDMQRPPWWQRRLRPDSFHLRLRDVTAATELPRRPDDPLRLEVQSSAVTGGYSETEHADTVHFFTVSGGAGCSLPPAAAAAAGGATGVGLDWPRAVLTVFPTRREAALLDADTGSDSPPPVDSSSSSPFAGLSAAADARQPSPFAARRVVYETNSHARGQPELSPEGEELVVPASREEVDRFVDQTAANCQLLLELSLPRLEAILPHKRFYELIYNRLATDLALWEPSAPSAAAAAAASGRTSDPQHLLADPFHMCKSGTLYDSDSVSESDDEAMYQSVEQQRARQQRRQRHQAEAAGSRQSRLCLRLTTQQACVALQTPCLTEEGTPVAGHHGEVQLLLDAGSLFVTSGYAGLYGHGYICLHAQRASLFHKGQMPTRAVPVLPSVEAVPPCLDRLVSCYRPDGAAAHTDDMLSVAVKYQLDEENHIKTFTVAVGVDGCCLRQRVLPQRQLFVNQLIDMFDVLDFPVAGYNMPATVTELHLQITRSALDYRPLYLPYQYLLTVDSFTLSSHMVAATATSVLRFILEEAALHVAERSGAALASPRDYCCVLEAGLLELSVRTSPTPASGQPTLDWRLSNNVVHLRTCSDSLRALVQLVTYLAGDGDLGPAAAAAAGDPPPPPAQPPPPPPADAEVGALAEMMEDAMQEASPPRRVPAATNQGPVEVFFFPNEPHLAPPPPPQPATEAQPTGTVLATMAEALGEISEEFVDADESFCVLDDDPGSGIRSRSGEPHIRQLCAEPIRIVDGFLAAPLSRADVLRPPQRFSVPRRRYTLHQMSLHWSLYGGHDLPSSAAQHQPAQRKVRIESPVATPPGSPSGRLASSPDSGASSPASGAAAAAAAPMEVSFSRHSASAKVRFGRLTPPASSEPPPNPVTAARLRGGPGRRLDQRMELRLNKARAQWEEYPADREEASRLVMVVHDVEVLDRIASSDINKFLYQYSSEACPRQAHSNMVLLKALSRRPDPSVSTEETDVRVSLCPIRLNVDQDALFFIRDFFRDAAGQQGGGTPATVAAAASDAPVLSITQQRPASPAAVGGRAASPESDDSGEDAGDSGEDAAATGATAAAAADRTFFRTFTFSPEVLIRIDYQGKRVDIGQFGPLIGLIIGLGQLNCSQITLKRISHKSGLLGLDRLVHFALNEWLTDIRRNQLPSLIGGIGPLHSFMQLFQGIRDLVWLPIEQYQRDGRIVKGLQRGANSFSTSTAMAFLELTNRLVTYIQSASEFTYDMVSSGPPVRQSRGRQRRPQRRRTSNLPQDLREGVTNAYQLVKEGLGETAQTLARVAVHEHDQKGVSGAVGGVLRQIPPTMVTPILLASEATSNVLGGMRNQLAPDARQEAIDKWKPGD